MALAPAIAKSIRTKLNLNLGTAALGCPRSEAPMLGL